MIYISTIINPSGNRINVLFYDDQEDCFYSTGDKKAMTIQILPSDDPIGDEEIFNIDPNEFVAIGEPRGHPEWTGNTIIISGQEINQIRSSSCCEGCQYCGSEPLPISSVGWRRTARGGIRRQDREKDAAVRKAKGREGVDDEGMLRGGKLCRRGGGKIKSSKRRRKSRKRRKSKRKSTRRRG